MSAEIRLPSGGVVSVGPCDHTRLMQLLMSDPAAVAERLPKTGPDTSPFRFDPAVPQLALALPRASAELRTLLEAMAEAGELLQQAAAHVPPDLRLAGNQILRQVHAVGEPARKLAVLRQLKGSDLAREPALAAGIEVAIGILEDGLATIYSEDHPFYRTWPGPSGRVVRQHGQNTAGKPPSPDELSDSDIDGAIAGGIIGGAGGAAVGAIGGSIGPGAGAVPGGATGAVLGSAGGALVGAVYGSGSKVIKVIGDAWGRLTGGLQGSPRE